MKTIDTASPPANLHLPLYRRILVATDFSLRSDCAFDQGLELARQNAAELLVLHAYSMPATLCFLPPSDYHQWQDDSRKFIEDRLQPLADRARENHVRCHKLLLAGLPEDVILDVARKLKVDLVVLGSRRRRGIRRFVLGSAAARITNRLQCPVLTVTSRSGRKVSSG